jgi:hypothetical protein
MSLAGVGPLIGLGLQVVGDFGLQDLIEQAFQELPQGLVVGEQTL